ncbi:MAG: murein biosynthesis integral membrane protein MurJ [Planctomycetota bacterium]
MPTERAHDDDRALGRSTLTLSTLTLLSRVLGLVRDLLTARVFADTAVGSAFAAAFAIPNLFRRLFGEGALSAAFIPDYTRLSDGDPRGASLFASLTLALLALATGAITIALELALLVLLIVLPGDPDRDLSLRLVMVTLPYMPLICGAAVLGGMLQARGRFAPWAAAPVLLNLCLIGATTPFFFTDGADARTWSFVVACAAVGAGVLQLLWMALALRGLTRWHGWRAIRGAWSETWPRARAMLIRMGPVLIGLGTLQLNALIDNAIAMWPNWVGPTAFGRAVPLDVSSNAVLFYAQRLYQFPLGVFGIAVATAAFPMLSRAAGDPERFARAIARGVRLSLFIALPASVGLIIVREPLVRTVFTGSGGFSDDGAARAAAVLAGYGVAVWAYALNQLWARVFYARGDTSTPMRVAVAMVAINIPLNLLLIWPLREAGLAWSTALCAIGQCVVLAWLSRAPLAGLVRHVLHAAGAALAAGGGALLGGWLADALLLSPATGGAWTSDAIRLTAMVAGGGLAWLAVVLATRRPELAWLLRRG